MKANIDLTQNRDFRSRKFISSIREYFVQKKYPWEFQKSSCDSYQDELFLTGDSYIRDKKKRYLKNESECSRCGRNIDTIAWKRSYDLCVDCEKDIAQYISNNTSNNQKP